MNDLILNMNFLLDVILNDRIIREGCQEILKMTCAFSTDLARMGVNAHANLRSPLKRTEPPSGGFLEIFFRMVCYDAVQAMRRTKRVDFVPSIKVRRIQDMRLYGTKNIGR
jgi:hypothetical protein